MGLSAALLYVLFPGLSSHFGKFKAILFSSALFSISTFFLTFYLKTDSSQGRWFIWKQSIQLWKENWVCGVGFGRFNPEFNHMQAGYFSGTTLYSKEAMLANDGYFAFNEWIHFAIELGVLGLLLSIGAAILILRACFKKINSSDSWAGAMLIPVFVGSFFSYPLHNFYILSVSCLLAGYITRGYVFFRTRPPKWVVRTVVGLALGYLTWQGVLQLKLQRQFIKAKELAMYGYKTEAYKTSVKISERMKKSYRFTVFYFNLLYETNRLDEATGWYAKFHHFHCNQRSHLIAAKCFEELNNFKKAEENYLLSLYLKPQVLQSRINLMEFYNRTKEINKAKYWAEEAISYPAKFQNEKVDVLRKQAQNFIQQLKSEK